MSDKDIIDMKEENGQWSAYVSEFSPEKLWEKIKGHAKKVGCEGIRSALRLFYALDNPSMPLKTKMVIYGALGYFISPIDVIPDFIPVVGFTDEIGVLGGGGHGRFLYRRRGQGQSRRQACRMVRGRHLLKRTIPPSLSGNYGEALRHALARTHRKVRPYFCSPRQNTIRNRPRARRPQWRPSDAAGLQARCSTAA